jgi:hypothetical protein
MTRPTWATVVGIIGIILAGFGVLGSINSIISPFFFTFQKEMISTIQESVEEINNDETPQRFSDLFGMMWNVPNWWRIWLIVSGIISLGISAFLLTASILLLQIKRSSIMLFYWAAGLTIGFNFIGTIAALLTGSFLAMGKSIGYLFGLIVAVVLLIVTATGEKKVYMKATQA